MCSFLSDAFAAVTCSENRMLYILAFYLTGKETWYKVTKFFVGD